MSRQLLLRKGVEGQVLYGSGKQAKWYQVEIIKTPTLDKKSAAFEKIDVHYTDPKYKNEYQPTHEDELRCLDCSENEDAKASKVYVGMWSKCRSPDEESTVCGLGLNAYVPGKITAISGGGKGQRITFAFGGDPERAITATPSDLLYWGVPGDISEGDIIPTPSEAEEESVSDEEVQLPPRKRRAPEKLDPATYQSMRIIEDSDSGADDRDGEANKKGRDEGKDDDGSSGTDKELFPDSSDEEDGHDVGERQGGQASKSNPAQTGAWGSPAAASTSSSSGWGTPAAASSAASRSGWGTAALSSISTPSGASIAAGNVWGQSSSVVTPTSTGGWGDADATNNNWASSNSNTWASASSGFGSAPVVSPREIQYRYPIKYGKRADSDYAVQSNGVLEVYREANDDFFLRWRFGERIKVVEVGANECKSLEKRRTIGQYDCVLVASKFEKSDARPSKYHARKFTGAHVKAFYLAVGGPGIASVKNAQKKVQKELDAIASFSELALKPGKLAARLELLVSTAMRAPNKSKSPLMFLLNDSYFKEVSTPENQTVGCGFIPSDLLEELLGGGKDAQNAIAVQVRVVSPCFGVFKGMLVRKQGIKTIELPGSMKKVGKSLSSKKSFKGTFLLFNSICPSTDNAMMERHINPHLPNPTKSSKKDLKGLGPMIWSLLTCCGIPNDVLKIYDESVKGSFSGRCHTYLTGVSDCTGALPEGSVFLTGFGVGGGTDRKVFLTRVPCTERSDGMILPVVSEKPENMSDEDWEHIMSLPFGAVLFASPKDPNAKSLPEKINDSDLDGDLFFALWNEDEELFSHVESSAASGNDEGEAPEESSAEAEPESESEDDNCDELIGTHIPLLVNAKTKNAVIVSKTNEGEYLVKAGAYEETLTYDEIMKDREMIEDIVGHRGKGRSAEVEVLWKSGKRSWQALKVLKEETPRDIAEYAQQAGLLDEMGWAWARDYIHEAEIIEVSSHRFRGKGVELEVLYDGDAKTEWTNAREIDVDIIAGYVERKGVSLKSKRWDWLDKSIKKEKKIWFRTVQERVADVKHMAEHNRLVEALHGAHKKRNDLNDPVSIAYGQAFKKAIASDKHEERVPLSEPLRDEMIGKTSTYADKFLKLE